MLLYSSIYNKIENLMSKYDKGRRRIMKKIASDNKILYLNELFIICKCKCFLQDTKEECDCPENEKIQEMCVLFS
jgi:hypothetical protein